jgi:nitrite reductase/ring-hydroxylating ferredoxin subunit
LVKKVGEDIMTFYVLCKTNEVADGEMKQFKLKEVEVLVIKHSDKFYCFQARCTHAGAPLVEGELKDDVLQCPWHGSRFNIINGQVIRGPAEKPLRSYNNIIEEDKLLIELLPT